MWFLSSRKNRRSNSAPTRRPRARLCLEMLEDRCVPSAGQLDPTFGSGGIVTNTNFGNDSAVVLQPDGKVVTVAQNSSLVRYTTSGSLDSTFGSGGVATTAFGADAIALQSDGRIVIAGTGGGSFALERFNANGSLDKTFGKGGEVTTPFIKKGVYTGAVGRGVVIQGDGKIVVAGYTNNQEWALARYNANGSLDTTFGSGGKVVSVISPGGNEIRGIAIQPDGKLVVAGNYMLNSRSYFAVGRYNSNGTFDSSFGSGGLVTTAIDNLPTSMPEGDSANALALQSDGKILLVGTGLSIDPVTGAWINQWELARYNPDGSLDTTFGGTGFVTTQINAQASNSQIAAVAIQPWDGKIVVAGNSANGIYPDVIMALGRYNPDGSLDTTFNGTGIVTTQTSNYSWANGVAIYPISGTANDGKIVAVGVYKTTRSGPLYSVAARYLSSEPEIASFTAGTNPVTAGSSETLTVSGIADGNAGATIAQVAFYYIDSNNNQQLLGYGTQTSPGVWSYTFTVNLASGSYTLLAQAEDSYGVFGDPVALTLTVQ